MISQLDQLRQRYPEWEIRAIWVTASSGPDGRTWQASRGGVTINTWTPEALEAAIGRMETQ